MLPTHICPLTHILSHDWLCAGFTAVDYAFQRRMTMSHRVPNSFELIMRAIIHVAVFAGPFEVKLNRCGQGQLPSMNSHC